MASRLRPARKLAPSNRTRHGHHAAHALPVRHRPAPRRFPLIHDEAQAVAEEQLLFWASEGVSVTDIARELNGGRFGRPFYFASTSRDDLLCLIASRWLGVAR